MNNIFFDFWASACLDNPKHASCTLHDGNFVFAVKTGAKLKENVKNSGVPDGAIQSIQADGRARFEWPSVGDALLGEGGAVSHFKSNYEKRLPQIQMARMVQRAVEMTAVTIIEAGTGTGKSFAYLAPVLAMKKKAVISTSNKALQAQLVGSDAPFLQQIFPSAKIVLAQGKSNYLCLAHTQDKLGNQVAFDPKIREWINSTDDGNLENIPFEIELSVRGQLAAGDDCPGQKSCAHGAACHYYKSKAARRAADIIICNHALLCMSQLYPSAEILPAVDALIIDEAHQLPNYARNALGAELKLSYLAKLLDGTEIDDTDFRQEIYDLHGKQQQRVIEVAPTAVFINGIALSEEMIRHAHELFPESQMPTPDEIPIKREADRLRAAAAKISQWCHIPIGTMVRWLEHDAGSYSVHLAPYDVSDFISKFIDYENTPDPMACAWCHRPLSGEHVARMGDAAYHIECSANADPFGDAEYLPLADWHPSLIENRGQFSVIFTSATLAAPDMSAFKSECGIQSAMEMIVASPFDYAKNCTLYVPNGASPDPKKSEWSAWAINEIRELIAASHGGVFLLFTSYANMQATYDALAPELESRYKLLIQGKGVGKLEMARRFKHDGNAILFGTKSFFEGVSIEGDALRLVVVDKLPFAAPHPISKAREAALVASLVAAGKTPAEAGWQAFEQLAIPAMTLDLKQAFGRLIRTKLDSGVVAILDARLRTAKYGRNLVLPSLPPARLVDSNLSVLAHFEERMRAAHVPTIQTRPAIDFSLVELAELPF